MLLVKATRPVKTCCCHSRKSSAQGKSNSKEM